MTERQANNDDQEPKSRQATSMGYGIAIGVGVGVALGIALDSLMMGIAIGAGVGVALGSAGSAAAQNKNETNPRDDG